MTDKELLELAAKAAGITPINVTEDGVVYGESIMECDYWNPLTDDGDALRLAVTLMLDICCHERGAHVDGAMREHHTEESGDDPYAATRRAIVRAAAEIGKAL